MRGCVDAMQESPVATIPVVSAPREWEMGNGKWARSAIASAYGLRLTPFTDKRSDIGAV